MHRFEQRRVGCGRWEMESLSTVSGSDCKLWEDEEDDEEEEEDACPPLPAVIRKRSSDRAGATFPVCQRSPSLSSPDSSGLFTFFTCFASPQLAPPASSRFLREF
ncbi:hypothetical protein F2P81_013437 [Scophthalmus maximus]|uniref:Uncharacterized protein n=1 Tax=Scophthalmus maximus TaxID=52904 RepID=A0A6A4SQT3_SCOMX|nr:hypothetical protein F2P81_013437 [Scophthalmus maximus]